MYLVEIQGCIGLDMCQKCLLKSFSGSDLTPNVSASLQDQYFLLVRKGRSRSPGKAEHTGLESVTGTLCLEMSIWLFFNVAFHSARKMGEMLFDTSLLNPAWEAGVALNPH